jgi:hypothetical protein
MSSESKPKPNVVEVTVKISDREGKYRLYYDHSGLSKAQQHQAFLANIKEVADLLFPQPEETTEEISMPPQKWIM